MSTEKATVDFILDQLAPLPVRARAMFGEYGLYCDERFVALICDDTLFVKPTAISDQFFSDTDLAPPYRGAKDHYAVPAVLLEESERLREVIARTAVSACPETEESEESHIATNRKSSDIRPRSAPKASMGTAERVLDALNPFD